MFEDQPAKFAAMELVTRTGPHQPVTIGGVLVGEEVVGGIRLPELGSVLAGFSPDTVITGFDQIPVDQRPPATIVHLAWDTMVGIGTALVLLGLWAFVLWRRRRDYAAARWFLRAASVAGIGAIVALEAGWIVTEVGRQPWVVYLVLRTSDAVTTARWRAGDVRGGDPPVCGARARDADRAADPAASLGASRCGRRREGHEGRGRRPDPVRAVAPVMSTVDITAVVLWLGVTAYAVFGGADFGGGFWDLVAGRGEQGDRARALIADSIGPVWETNHTWLIFDLVVLWTAFPVAFAAIMTTLFIPLSLAAFGIVLRGAAFAFRPLTSDPAGRRAASAVFAASSVITPFFLGTAVGAIAGGRVASGTSRSISWARG